MSNLMIDELYQGPHVVIAGDLAGGCILYGPFSSWVAARQWAADTIDGNELAIMRLEPPDGTH
jgi:hypothetical protein